MPPLARIGPGRPRPQSRTGYVVDVLSPKVWKVHQYCYFWISSEVVTAEQITSQVGMEPDSITVRGSRQTEPRALPIEHSWMVKCGRHARIDEQVSEVLDRVRPAAQAIRVLTAREDVDAGLMMVRYFDDPDEGGYDAMGWMLEPAQIVLLADMGAQIQADEYLANAHPSTYESRLRLPRPARRLLAPKLRRTKGHS